MTTSTELRRNALFVGDCAMVMESARAMALFGWGEADNEKWKSSGTAGLMLDSIGRDHATYDVAVCCAKALDGETPPFEVPVIVVTGCLVENPDQSLTEVCSELVTYMRSGLGLMTRKRGESGLRGTPFLPAGHLAAFFAGLHVALLAESFSLRTDPGPRLVRLSASECLLATLHNAAGFAQLEARDVSRDADPTHAGGRFACADGEVLISLPDAHHWESLLAAIGSPDWADGGWWRDSTTRFENKDLLNDAIAAWCKDKRRTNVFCLLQDRGIPAAYLASPQDVAENPQLADRGHPQAPPHRARWSESSTTSLPEVASSEDVINPLAGVRVSDLSWAWSGPYLTMSLAMLGAEVIKVESPTRLDIHRQQPPFVAGSEASYERAAGHLLTNRGKLSLESDLKSPEGLALVKELIARSDVLVANFTPGVLAKLGLGFDDLQSEIGNRPFVYLTLTGFGSSGPWAGYRSYGTHLADLSGLSALTGTAGTSPVNIAIPFADPLAGIYGAVAAVHFLNQARRQNSPVEVDISQFEVVVTAIREAVERGVPEGNLRAEERPPSGVYQCFEPDTWIAVSVTGHHGAATIRELLRLEPDAPDQLVETALRTWAAALPAHEAEVQLNAHGLTGTQVFSVAELLTEPTLAASGFWEPHEVRDSPLLGPAAPWLIDGVRPDQLPLAPHIGEHTDLVKRKLSFPTRQNSKGGR